MQPGSRGIYGYQTHGYQVGYQGAPAFANPPRNRGDPAAGAPGRGRMCSEAPVTERAVTAHVTAKRGLGRATRRKKIRAKADVQVNASAVNVPVNAETRISEREIIDANAQAIVSASCRARRPGIHGIQDLSIQPGIHGNLRLPTRLPRKPGFPRPRFPRRLPRKPRLQRPWLHARLRRNPGFQLERRAKSRNAPRLAIGGHTAPCPAKGWPMPRTP